jgi:hypothetical protein
MISHGNFVPVPPVGVNPAPLIIIICRDVTTILLINKLHDQREISFLGGYQRQVHICLSVADTVR